MVQDTPKKRYSLSQKAADKQRKKYIKQCPHCGENTSKRGHKNEAFCNSCDKLFCWRCGDRFTFFHCTKNHVVDGCKTIIEIPLKITKMMEEVVLLDDSK